MRTRKLWSVLGAEVLVMATLVADTKPVLGQSLPAQVIRGYLWPTSEEEFKKASKALGRLENQPLDRASFARVERILREGPSEFETVNRNASAEEPLQLTAESANGPIPLLVSIPSQYSADRAWPLIVAMHGGPPQSREQALRGAHRMLSVWAEAAAREGWVVVAPAMVGTSSVDQFTRERLPYEIFHPEDFRAVVRGISHHFRIDPDRIVSTGISLGSNFSIAYAAAHPDWLSAIVPVSTEGESRQRLLKNLFATPVYVLEGTQDRNIRTISGPRAMEAILAREAYDFVYIEMSDRAHEGFSEFYPDVLRWLSSRPRQLYPKRVLRSPHSGIVPLSRRLFWLESASAEGQIEAKVVSPNRIEITAARTPSVDIYLHDRLVDLDSPLEVFVNGKVVFQGSVKRSLRSTLNEVKKSGDHAWIFPARLSLDVPLDESAHLAAKQLAQHFHPVIPEGQLSFWEMYAVRALQERLPKLGWETEESSFPEELPSLPEQIGLLLRRIDPQGPLKDSGLQTGDLIVRFGDHLFFSGSDHDLLFHLSRELRNYPRDYEVQIWRSRQLKEIRLQLALGDYMKKR